uniref:Uncharacterized protein n=1 Tax=Lygus hesperus TaxID=30085 RepID=A0A0A9WZM7_LYGHE
MTADSVHSTHRRKSYAHTVCSATIKTTNSARGTTHTAERAGGIAGDTRVEHHATVSKYSERRWWQRRWWWKHHPDWWRCVRHTCVLIATHPAPLGVEMNEAHLSHPDEEGQALAGDCYPCNFLQIHYGIQYLCGS